MYGKCGYVDEAAHMFDTMPERNLVSWNTMMSAFSDNALLQDGFDLFKEMLSVDEESMRPDDATVVTVLPMCAVDGWLEMGRVVHGMSVKLDLDHELRVSNALVDMYAKCGCLSDAQCLFGHNQQRNVVSWNALIGGVARNGDVDGAFDLMREMQSEEGIKANEVTVLNVLPACLGPSELQHVKELHAYAIRNGLQTNDLVPNALMAAYAKCGLLDSADNIFKDVEIKTVSAWNALIGGYAQNGDPNKAIELFLQMSSSGLEPDWFSCGRSQEARLLFDAMEDKDSVSWNALIAGYLQNGLTQESLQLFRQMQHEGCEPSIIATTSVFMACAELSALPLGQEAHCYALKVGFTADTFLGSSIIDMYAKCGSIEHARTFFDNLKDKDAVSWTVMITGYGINGFGGEAIDLYNEMEGHGLKPDAFTYLGILMACNHAGLVEEGLRYFEDMKNKHGLEPKLEHYACVADMLGRVGKLAEAARIIEDMPEEPDGRIWSALLAACRTHGDICLGERVIEKLLELEPDKAEHYVLASNLYASSGRWDGVRRIRNRMKEIGLQKDPGFSWIDVGGRVFDFVSGDNRLPESEEIHRMWCSLEEKIRGIGYVPDTSSVLHEKGEEEKLKMLRGHSEKQAISFGLLKTSGNKKIRVCKNIRICRDCHNAAKLVGCRYFRSPSSSRGRRSGRPADVTIGRFLTSAAASNWPVPSHQPVLLVVEPG
ncbi:Pentatricopeptide repeat-containing protein [Musa troglodytarum]|uniref:Pentatricopeptide repeat-containing protein n=1 Tax=Musa troglodytarum TaxID=320322 RepID=A0A9E7I643_9LILI|nr:Pentatricopeptide repeat-containing protein [Musa troglodytarum]